MFGPYLKFSELAPELVAVALPAEHHSLQGGRPCLDAWGRQLLAPKTRRGYSFLSLYKSY